MKHAEWIDRVPQGVCDVPTVQCRYSSEICEVYLVGDFSPTPRFQRDRTVSGLDWWLRCRFE